MVAELLRALKFETKRLVISRSRFPNKASLEEIRNYLRQHKATGRLIVDMSQGGTNCVQFEEEQHVDGATEIRIQ